MPNSAAISKRTDPVYQAQAILARRSHSEAEVRTKLARKSFSASQIDEAIAWLKGKKLLDDTAFARLYVENTLRFKAVGPRWLKMKLQQKRITSDIIEATLTLLIDDGEERRLIAHAATKWQAAHSRQKEDALRLQRFLLARGFSSRLISDFLKRPDGDV